jgi:hypothetical protein
MGRPLNSNYFGNRQPGGIGGEGVASVTIGGSWANFAEGTTTVTFGAPNLLGGVQATGSAVIVGGAVTAVTITEPGSGYTSAPSVTIVDVDGGGETTGTATAVLTSRPDSFTISAFVPGGSSAVAGDIVKQVGAKTFRVTTAQGTGLCKLVGAAPAAGEMSLIATDSNGSTYYVTKISRHKATLTQLTLSGSFVYATGSTAKWTLGSAVAPSGSDVGTVSIANSV